MKQILTTTKQVLHRSFAVQRSGTSKESGTDVIDSRKEHGASRFPKAARSVSWGSPVSADAHKLRCSVVLVPNICEFANHSDDELTTLGFWDGHTPTYKHWFRQQAAEKMVNCGSANLKVQTMTISHQIRSPLQSDIMIETDRNAAERLQQILNMRRMLDSDSDDAMLSAEPEQMSSYLETIPDSTEAVATSCKLTRARNIRLVHINRRRRSLDSDADSDSSLSLAETLVNQSAEQVVRNKVFRQTHRDLTDEVEILMENASVNQERLGNWINSMADIVENLERRRKYDSRLDASLHLLEQECPKMSSEPKRRSLRR